MTIKFSLIIGFKDRSITRVSRCLESLRHQTKNNFEVILIDYGSSEKYKTELAELWNKYDFLKLITVNAEGMFWNRAHALNIGAKEAIGKYLVTADIDLIFGKYFIENIEKHLIPDKINYYKCLYLPRGFKKFHQLSRNNNWKFKKSKNTGRGLSVLSKKLFFNVKGYDEYYFLWGCEDIDLSARLKAAGISENWFATHHFDVFHQWHPHSFKEMPSGAYSKMFKRFKRANNNININGWGIPFEIDKRIAYKLFSTSRGNACKIKFEIKSNLIDESIMLTKRINSLTKGESMLIIDKIYPQNRSMFSRFLLFFNILFDRVNINHRFVTTEEYFLDHYSKMHIKSLFYFLIAEIRDMISDYYLINDGDQLAMIIVG